MAIAAWLCTLATGQSIGPAVPGGKCDERGI